MFDFIPIVVDGLCLTMYPQPPEYDIGTFIRPFRQARYFDLNRDNILVKGSLNKISLRKLKSNNDHYYINLYL